MLTLEEIYNKYLTMDRIEDDSIIEKLFNDFSPKSEEFLSAEYINTVINNPLINKQELKKLYNINREYQLFPLIGLIFLLWIIHLFFLHEN